MINRVVLTGRLTKDPEMKFLQSGIAVTRFTLAVNRAFKSSESEQQADFINCVAWRKQAENVANYLSKGSLVGVDGRIQTSNFEGQDGKRIFMTDVVAESVQFLESKNAQNDSQRTNKTDESNSSANNFKSKQGQNGTNNSANNPFAPKNDEPIEITDDDLPF